MRLRIAAGIIGMCLLGYTASLATAQSDKETTHKKVRAVTGCLEKAGEHEYRLTTAQGATWEIKSDAVNLGEHVGHTVTVRGVVPHAAMHGAKEDAKDEAKEHGVDKDATEHGHLTATDLKMVSESCKR